MSKPSYQVSPEKELSLGTTASTCASKPSCQESIEEEISLGSFYSGLISAGPDDFENDNYQAEAEVQGSVKHKWSLRGVVFTLGVLRIWKKEVRDSQRERAQLTVRILMVICLQVLSVIIIDRMLKRDRQAMMLITAADYIFCTSTSLFAGGESILLERKIPATWHAAFTILNFGQNSLKNAAVGMVIPTVIVLVVSNAGLPISMLVDFLLLRERFSSIQLFGALIVTLGILQTVESKGTPERSQRTDLVDHNLFLPVALLLGSVFVRQIGSTLGQHVAKKYGKNYEERMFYQCAGGLSMLLWNGRSLLHKGESWLTEKREDVFGVGVPVLWLFLMLNMLLSYLVKSSCIRIVAMSNSTVMSITSTAQRAISITLSAILFSPSYPPLAMWFGVANVVAGAASFAVAPRVQSAHKKVK